MSRVLACQPAPPEISAQWNEVTVRTSQVQCSGMFSSLLQSGVVWLQSGAVLMQSVASVSCSVLKCLAVLFSVCSVVYCFVMYVVQCIGVRKPWH